MDNFSQIFDNLYDGVIVTDNQGVIIEWNRGATVMFGYTREQALGSTPAILHSETDAPGLTQTIIDSVEVTGSWRGEISAIHRDGTVVITETTVAAQFDEFGVKVGTVGVNRDITERSKAEQVLRDYHSELEEQVKRRTADLSQVTDRLQHLISKSPAIMYTCTLEGDFRATFVGSNVSNTLGHMPEAFEDPGFWLEQVHPNDKAGVYAWIEGLVRGGPKAHEYRFRTASNAYVWVRDEITIIRDVDGIPIEGIGFLSDIMARKSAELELQASHVQLEDRVARRTQELSEVNALLEATVAELQLSQQALARQERINAVGIMASGLSHNLNNLLSPAVALADLALETGKLPDKERTWMQGIRTSTSDAAGLVRQLGLLSGGGLEPAEEELVDLREILDSIPLLTKGKWESEPRMTGREVELTAELLNVEPVYGNSSSLRQVFTNLVFNAVDAIPARGTINLVLMQEGDRVLVKVQDTGSGMSETVLANCLEPFYTTKNTGTGLGLALCSSILKSHGASMSLESQLGHGTSVFIEFPVAHSRPRGQPSADDSVVAPAELSARSILVIDDQVQVCTVVATLLRSMGHSVDVANSGTAGLDAIRKRMYDVVISDFTMPGMDGREVATEVKAFRPDTWVILVTGWPVAQVALMNPDQASEDLILEKPLSLASLRTAIAEDPRFA